MTASSQHHAITRRSAVALAGLALAGAALEPVLAWANAPEKFVSPVGSTVEPSVPTVVTTDRVEGEFYSFDVPEYWRGRVFVEAEGASAWVRPLCCPQAQLVSVHVREAGWDAFLVPGNPDHRYVYGVDDGRGQYVYVDVQNFAMWLAGGRYDGILPEQWEVADPEAVMAELLDLSTGGAVTSQQAREGSDGACSASYDFCDEFFLPAFEVRMDEDWARLAALEASDWESETLCAFAGRAALELADASGGLD